MAAKRNRPEAVCRAFRHVCHPFYIALYKLVRRAIDGLELGASARKPPTAPSWPAGPIAHRQHGKAYNIARGGLSSAVGSAMMIEQLVVKGGRPSRPRGFREQGRWWRGRGCVGADRDGGCRVAPVRSCHGYERLLELARRLRADDLGRSPCSPRRAFKGTKAKSLSRLVPRAPRPSPYRSRRPPICELRKLFSASVGGTRIVSAFSRTGSLCHIARGGNPIWGRSQYKHDPQEGE